MERLIEVREINGTTHPLGDRKGEVVRLMIDVGRRSRELKEAMARLNAALDRLDDDD